MGSPVGMSYVLSSVQERQEIRKQKRLGGQRATLLRKAAEAQREAPPQLPGFQYLHRYAEWCYGRPFCFQADAWGNLEGLFAKASEDKEVYWSLLYEYVRWAKALHKLGNKVLSPTTVSQFLRRKTP